MLGRMWVPKSYRLIKIAGYCFFDIAVQQKSWDVPGEKGIQELAFTYEDFIGRFSNLKLRLPTGIFSCTTLSGTFFAIASFFIIENGDRTASFYGQQLRTTLKITVDPKACLGHEL